MSEYKIEKGIEVPDTRQGNAYPLKHMEIGDSFFVPISRVKSRDTFYASARHHRIKVTVRTIEEDGIAGHRVWRVS